MPGPSKARRVPLDCLSCLRVAERIKPSFCRISFKIFFSFSGLHGGMWSKRMNRYAGTVGSGPRNTFAPMVLRFMLLTWSKSKVVSSSLSPSEKVNSVWQCVYKKSYKKQHSTVHLVTAIVWQTLRTSRASPVPSGLHKWNCSYKKAGESNFLPGIFIYMKILSFCVYKHFSLYIYTYSFMFCSTILYILLHMYLFCRPRMCLHMDSCSNLFIKYFFIYDWIRNLRQFLHFDYQIMENQIMRVHVPTQRSQK